MGLYRALLHLYPASFRHEYGEEMARLFAARYRRASAAGRVGLWLEALGDAIATAPGVHFDVLKQDLAYSRRTLARSRGFAAIVVLVTALGTGATTAVFSIADRVLLRPLPFTDPDRLVRIWERVPGYSMMEPSPPNYADWRLMAGSFDGMAAHTFVSLNLILREPERVAGTAVTSNLFELLGAQAAAGRTFLPGEDRPGAEPVALLSDRLWRRAFAADPDVIGRRVRLNEETVAIAGVMPPEFQFPTRETEIWIPLRLAPQNAADRDNNMLGVVARMKDGVTLEQARTEMDAVMASLERAYPRENEQSRATVRLLADQVPAQSRLLIRALAGASFCLLLIACTNLANLLLTRAIARRRELSVRAALGAGRDRLIRQLLTESLLLSACGGLLGVALAAGVTPLLSRLVPTTLPVADASALDGRVLLFAALMTTLTGVVFGVLPALRVTRRADAAALREGPRAAGTGRERLRAALVLAQITASVLLLVSAGLLMRALLRVQSIDPGFNASNVFTARTPLESSKYEPTAARARFYDRVLSDVRALPGVTAAAYTSFAPFTMRGGVWPVEIPGLAERVSAAAAERASLRFVTPGYFSTLDVPILLGRDVAESDTMDSQAVVVVSESFARRYWPSEQALGRTFTFAFRERTVVGIAGDVRVRGLERESEPQVYVPYRQVPDGALTFYAPRDLLVRTSGEPLALGTAIREVVRRADPEVPLSDMRTMEDLVGLDTAPRQTQVRVLALFAACALLLAAVGIHGLLAFSVAQRTREIGVRVALGAPRTNVLRLIVGESAALALLGTAAGMLLGYAGGQQLTTVLAGVHPFDPGTYAIAGAMTVLMTLSGSLIPVTRALSVDPVTALKAG